MNKLLKQAVILISLGSSTLLYSQIGERVISIDYEGLAEDEGAEKIAEKYKGTAEQEYLKSADLSLVANRDKLLEKYSTPSKSPRSKKAAQQANEKSMSIHKYYTECHNSINTIIEKIMTAKDANTEHDAIIKVMLIQYGFNIIQQKFDLLGVNEEDQKSLNLILKKRLVEKFVFSLGNGPIVDGFEIDKCTFEELKQFCFGLKDWFLLLESKKLEKLSQSN